jgi:transcriptional regulator with XRE-family HTH domain
MLELEQLDEGTRTRLLRVATGLSQYELAARAGIDRRRLSEHERGERPLRGVELARVHDVLKRVALPLKESCVGAVA